MKKLFLGIICGILNGLFGSGGGVAAVPLLENAGIEPRKSHATSVALIFALSLVTTVTYLMAGNLDFAAGMEYIPYGLAGAFVGGLLLKKLPNDVLRRLFGVIILISALLLLTR